MGKTIEVEKGITRPELDKQLAKLESITPKIDLSKYFGKVNFKKDGLKYQLEVRSEWQ